MADLLTGQIADIVNKAARGFFLDATLTRDIPASGGTAYDPAVSTQTTTYTCKAIEDTYSKGVVGTGIVDSTDIKVLILAGSLSTTPQPLDRITIRGKTVSIIPADSKGRLGPVTSDPARATWECRCRD